MPIGVNPAPSDFRSAPKYVVGNVPNGDSASAYAANGFFYFPDTGDGAGIAAALAAAAAVVGDVWVRPGTYDLSAGSVAVPMQIAANVSLHGAGQGATIILSKQNPDSQQAFECQAGVAISDVTISTNGSSTYSGVTSYAMVKATGGGVKLQDVSFTLQTTESGGSTGLRHAFLLDTGGNTSLPFASLENVFVQADGATTPTTTPTSLIKVLEGTISARAVTTFGGDIAYEVYNQNPDPSSGGSVLFAQDTLCIAFAKSGAWFHQIVNPGNPSGGALRLASVIFVGDFGGGALYGVQLQGGSLHVLRSNYVINVNTGVIVDPPVGVTASGQLSNTLINAFSTGVEIGTGTGAVNGFGVSDSDIAAELYGVRVEKTGTATEGITVASNTIATSYAGGSKPIYIQDALNTVPSGNVITQSDGGDLASSAIWVVNSAHCTCTDNLIVSDNGYGIRIDNGSDFATLSGNDVTLSNPNSAACYLLSSSRNVVQGNIARVDAGGSSACVGLDVTGTASLCTIVANTVEVEAGFGISIAGTKNSCNGNTMGVDTTPISAILVTGASNVVVGNVCGTTVPVTDTGAGNVVANNL
jgi:parallel beta-helix repeat protein